MMTQKQVPLSLCSQAVLTSLLLLMTAAQFTSSTLTRNRAADCRNKAHFFSTYDDNVHSGFKVLDGLRAQSALIDAPEVMIHVQLHHSF